ncbi:MAG: hypothetical protein CMI00_11125 [Oceanospirillaceae bacterium]|nr:hypothetical protein [Oceanospirillaceae bacterium]|tara:strand:- start:5 stop:742 length:738 start_codon:yes stop_codon:yes gene_type:complete
MSSFWSLADTPLHKEGDLEQNWCWLPGWSFSAEVFRPFWEALPGQHWIADYQNTASSLDQACTLAADAPANAIWVGWSLGGAIATLAAESANAAALVTLATGKHFLADAEHDGMASSDFDAFCSGLNASPDKTLKRFISLCTQGADDPRALMKALKDHQLEASPTLTDSLNWLTQFTLEAPALPGVHFYSQTDALQAQGLAPASYSQSGSHAFFLTPEGQQELLHWLRPLLVVAAFAQEDDHGAT